MSRGPPDPSRLLKGAGRELRRYPDLILSVPGKTGLATRPQARFQATRWSLARPVGQSQHQAHPRRPAPDDRQPQRCAGHATGDLAGRIQRRSAILFECPSRGLSLADYQTYYTEARCHTTMPAGWSIFELQAAGYETFSYGEITPVVEPPGMAALGGRPYCTRHPRQRLGLLSRRIPLSGMPSHIQTAFRCSGGLHIPTASLLWIREIVQERFRRLEVSGVEALGEPVVDRLEQRSSISGSALIAQQPGEAHRGPQFP